MRALSGIAINSRMWERLIPPNPMIPMPGTLFVFCAFKIAGAATAACMILRRVITELLLGSFIGSWPRPQPARPTSFPSCSALPRRAIIQPYYISANPPSGAAILDTMAGEIARPFGKRQEMHDGTILTRRSLLAGIGAAAGSTGAGGCDGSPGVAGGDRALPHLRPHA
jgi:hypothetical protein